MRKTASGSSADEQRVEVARARGRHERVDDLALTHLVGIGARRGAAHAAPRPARELAGRVRCPADDLGDLVERHAEHVVEDEREALGRRQRLEHDEQREPERVREDRCLLGIDLVVQAHDRLRQPAADVFLSPRTAGSQHVEADAADDGRQPAAEVRDGRRIGAAEPQPRLLHGVVGLAQRAQHPVGDGAQVRPVLLELLREPLSIVHVTFLRRHPSPR